MLCVSLFVNIGMDEEGSSCGVMGQVLAEVFAAYEQKVPLKVRQALATNRYLADDMFDSLRYNCPADKHLAVHFTHTPPVFSVPAFLNEAPTYIAYGFCLSFLAVCITIGIFRPQKQMPSDYLQVRVVQSWLRLIFFLL